MGVRLKMAPSSRAVPPSWLWHSVHVTLLLLLLSLTSLSRPVSAGFWSSSPSSPSSSSSVDSLSSELRLVFSVLENVPVGTFIGVIQSNDSSVQIEPPFLIVPSGDSSDTAPDSQSVSSSSSSSSAPGDSSVTAECNVDTELNIDQSSGEIRSAVELDRERCSHYSFVAISLTGVNVHVNLIIEDVNDNRPQFAVREVELEFAENSRPKDVKRSLPPALDADQGAFGVQSYRILSGNVGGAFRLLAHREKNDILYLDLQVNGVLDRETTAHYRLLIEASDGGTPPLKDTLLVRIAVLDLNDNEPVFSQSQYFGTVPENAPLGSQVLRVSATDADLDASGAVTYSLYAKHSPASAGAASDYFAIHPTTGVVSVGKALDYESQRRFELVVIAQDSGPVALEASALVSITVTDVADSQPTVSVLFLTTNSRPEIAENARVGDLIARIALNDAQGAETQVAGIELLGGQHDFGIKTSAGSLTPTSGHLLTVLRPLDRERRSHYSMTIVLRDSAGTQSNASIQLDVLDVNDNPPRFEQAEYHTTLPEAVDIGASVFQMRATDADADSALTYAFLLERPAGQPTDEPDDDGGEEHSLLQWFNAHNHTHRLASHTAWFAIEPRSGLIVTRTQVDCETDSEPRLVVLATDATPTPATDESQFVGFSATATLVVSISDINDNEPIFDQSFYNVTVREDRSVGACILQISATDPDCGVNALVNYSIAANPSLLVPLHHSRASLLDFDGHPTAASAGGGQRTADFELHPASGQLCIARSLDFERQALYDIPVLATDRGGLSTQALIKIQILDTNDNFPVFYPREYKVNLHSSAEPNRLTPIVIVAATDKDSAANGQIEYSLESTGNEQSLFDIDARTGEIFLVRSLAAHSAPTEFDLRVGARDGGGLVCPDQATVHIAVLPERDADRTALPVFDQRSYAFEIVENCARGSLVGVVHATQPAQHDSHSAAPPSYSIYSGDPDGYFAIDPHSGAISVRSPNLDRERHAYLLLNVQASSGSGGSSGRFAHTQVNVSIVDENDNVPRFAAAHIKISVSEATENGSVIFVAQAVDRDTGLFGKVRYNLYRAEGHSHSWDSEFPFAIEEHTGKIRLRAKLDFETRPDYKLRVVAIDGGQLSSQMVVDLLVQDANDNAPVFVGASSLSSIDISKLDRRRPSAVLPLFRLSVVENTHINSPVHQLRAHDIDTGNNGRLTFTMEAIAGPDSPAHALPFDIFPNTGVIHVRDMLDRESVATYYALVSVHDHGAPQQLNASAVVQITLEDANDNRPQWDSLVYHFDVSEAAQIGSLLGTVHATDADAGANATLTYELAAGSGTFRLDSKSGQLFLAEALDRETVAQYELAVQVADMGVPVLSSDERATVTVTVLDVNDNRPVFQSDTPNQSSPATATSTTGHDDELLDDSEEALDSQSTVKLAIGTPKGTVVGTFTATDADAGVNGTVTYSLGRPHDLLDIDAHTGALLTRTDVREPKKAAAGRPLEKLSIVATDGGGKRSRPKTIEIELVDRKAMQQMSLENAPSYEFSIVQSADSPPASFGYRVGVLDLPTGRKNLCGNRLFTNFQRQARENVPFFVDSDEDKPSQLNLLALTELNRTAYSLLLCIDWSQCSTTLLPYEHRLQQGAQQYHLQLNTQCDHLTRILVGQSLAENGHCEPLPLADEHRYDLKLSVVGLPESRQHIDLLSLNGSQCSGVEYELSSAGDRSEHALDYFAIVEQAGQHVLQFGHTDRSRALSDVVHELATGQSELVLTLTAHWTVGSRSSRSRSVPLRVRLLSADKRRLGAIGFVNEAHLELEEDCCRAGSPIAQARLNVSHDDFRVRYYLEHSAESEQFSLNADTGLVSLRRPLDYERRTFHQMNITAMVYDTRSLILSLSQILRLRVLNTNDESPVFTEQSYSCEVTENSPAPVPCVRLIATDADQLQATNLTYLMGAGYQYASLFHLDAQTGELSVLASLDREEQPHYDVPVFAFDADNRHYASKHVRVVVLDLNDNPPTVEPVGVVRLPENIPVGSRIVTLTVHDADSNPAGLDCAIVSGNVGQRFTLAGNELFVQAPLDREVLAAYELVISVSDGLHTALANVSVELEDVNDNAPLFEKSDYYAMLDLEGAYGWLPVVTVRAIDSDGDPLRYVIDTLSVGAGEQALANLTRYFAMDGQTGEITIHRSLIEPFVGALPSKRFSFQVLAIEAGRHAYAAHRARTRVHVTLIADGRSGVSPPSSILNPNGLRLSKYPFVIVADESRRSFRVGQEIGTIDLLGGANEQLKRSGQYLFRVIAAGQTDRSFGDYFHLHSQTGAVTVKQPLAHNYYEAIVEVSLGSAPGAEATRTLLQIFAQHLDQSRFVTPVVVDDLHVAESFPVGKELIGLSRYVRSTSSPGSARRHRFVLAYSNLRNFNAHFELKPQSGRLQLRKPLDYETQPSRIEIVAFSYSSGGGGALHEDCHLFNFTIRLANVDDTLAQFTQSHYIGTVRESEPTGQIVGRVNAIDIDDEPVTGAGGGGGGSAGGNRTALTGRRFGYFIVEGNEDNAFSIGADGTVRTNIVLDREIAERYRLRIVATDMRAHDSTASAAMPAGFLADEANYQHLTQCTFEVVLIDNNDNTPQLGQGGTQWSIAENAPVGTLLGQLTANDVDIYPALLYSLHNNHSALAAAFQLDLLTGQLSLRRPLTAALLDWAPGELVRQLELPVSASDSLHTATSTVMVSVRRDTATLTPTFGRQYFVVHADLDGQFAPLTSEINVPVFRFEPDSAWNAANRKVVYRLESIRTVGEHSSSPAPFYLDRQRGVLYNNRTVRLSRPSRLYQLAVMARYEDAPDAWTRLGLFVSVDRRALGTAHGRKTDPAAVVPFGGHHQLEIEPDQLRVPLMRLPKLARDQYAIVGGNHNKNFMILAGNELFLTSRPLTEHYTLKIGRSPGTAAPNSTMFVHVKVRSGSSPDAHAQSPFKSAVFELEIDENQPAGTAVQSLMFGHIAEHYEFDIFSGNEAAHFGVHPTDGVLLVSGQLDYESVAAYRLGVRARSSAGGRSHFAVVNVVLNNINEFCPRFPSNFFKAIIPENSPPGTRVIPIRAIDADREPLNFTVTRLATGPQDDGRRDQFEYDAQSGYLTVARALDYEGKHRQQQQQQQQQHIHKYVVRVLDLAMAATPCAPVETLLEVQVGSVDEFAPKFSQESYHFKLAAPSGNAHRHRLKIGQVEASDEDAGPDGQVQFAIKSVTPASLADCLQVNATSGTVSLSLVRLRRKAAAKKAIGAAVLPKQFSLILTASSGRVDSLSSLAVVEVSVGAALFDERLFDAVAAAAAEDENEGGEGEDGTDLNRIESDPLGSVKEVALPGWLVFLTVLLLLVTLVLVVSIVVIRQAQTQQYMAGHYPGAPRPPGGHVGSLFRKIGPFMNGQAAAGGGGGGNQPIMEPGALSPAYSTAHYGNVGISLSPPCYNEIATLSGTGPAQVGGPQGAILSVASSSGRGSAEEGEEVDEEIRMINESSNYYTTGPEDDDGAEEGEIPTTAEYLARLGVVNHYEEPENVSSLGAGDDDDDHPNHHHHYHPHHQFGGGVAADLCRRPKRKKLPRVASSYSQYGPSTSGHAAAGASGTQQAALGSVNSLAMQQPHNGEEIAGSYNWDYLQHWGPKYQPLSSVFSEIARLKASESGQVTAGEQPLVAGSNASLCAAAAALTAGGDAYQREACDPSYSSHSQHSSSSARIHALRPAPIVAYQHFYELPPHHDSPAGSSTQHRLPYQQYHSLQSAASSNSNYSIYGMSNTSSALKQIIESNQQQTEQLLATTGQCQQNSPRHSGSNSSQI